MNKYRILITGGDSFIAKSIINDLQREDREIHKLSHTELDVYDDTFKLNKQLKGFRPNLLIHCASVGGRRNDLPNDKDLKINLKMLENILFNIPYFEKLIVFGSGAEFNITGNIFNQKENEIESIPNDDYSFFKYLQSELIKNNPKIINLRLFNVFGPYGMIDSFIPTVIRNCLKNYTVEIWEDKFFSSFYGRDLAKVINYFADKYPPVSKFLDINCVYKEKLKLSDIAYKIKLITKSKSDIIIKDEFGKSYHGNGDKLEELNLDLIGFEKGLQETIEIIRNEQVNNIC